MAYISVYINFPFCRQKCHFCDWVQRIPKEDLFLKAENSIRQKYIESLCSEIIQKGSELSKKGCIPKIVYWGGGTATTMTRDEIDKIVGALEEAFDLSEVSEWTIEGSPDTVTLDSLRYYRSNHFDRFSMGIQSFNDKRLKSLGRRHNQKNSIEAIELARSAGFKKISIDLMCGFPDETEEEMIENIEHVKDLGLNQLSLYTFRPTNGTMMRRTIEKYSKKLDPANQVKTYIHAANMLKSYGFREYGVGYFGEIAENVVGMFSLQYDVVGFGSGAVSVLDGDYCSHASGNLHGYIKNPLEYDIKVPITESNSAIFTLLRAGLSIYQGIRLDELQDRLKKPLAECLKDKEMHKIIDLFTKVGGLTIDDKKMYLSYEKAPLVLIGVVNGSMLTV